MKTYHYNFYAGGKFVGYLRLEYEDMTRAAVDIPVYRILNDHPDVDRIEILQFEG